MEGIDPFFSMMPLSEYALSSARRLWKHSFQFPIRPEGDFSFSREIARRMTSADRQHANITIFGQSGSGKSTVAIRLGELIDQALNEELGTERGFHFNLKNVAIGDQNKTDEIFRRMKDEWQKVYVIDEGIESAHNRAAMTKRNRATVKIMAVARTHQHCLIWCVQKKGMVDPQVLDLGTHEIQIVDPHHDEGYNIVKIKKLVLVADSPKIYRQYLSPNGRDRIVRHVIYMPEEGQYEEYKEMRVEGGNAIMEQGIEIRRGDEEQEKGRTRQQRERDERCERAWADYLDEGHEYRSIPRCAQAAGISASTLRLWMGRNGKDEGERVRGAGEVPAVRGRARSERGRLVDERCERAWADYEDEGHEYKSVTRCAREAGVDPKSLRLWMLRHGKKEWRLGGRGNVIGRR